MRLARTERVVIDVGTGDGRAAIGRARRDPAALVIGLDANASALAESSRRAAAPVRRGGQQNVLFVVAGIERPPAELIGLADEVAILFPWGSLLRGTLAVDDAAAAGIASLIRPGGRVTALVSITDRDGLELPHLDRDREVDGLAARWGRHGLVLREVSQATREEVAESGSSWGRRLTTNADRPIHRLELSRPLRSEDAFAEAG